MPRQEDSPYISVVIPVFNEEDNLYELHARLLAVLNNQDYTWEVIYVDDGSRDRSWEILKSFNALDPGKVRIISFNRNYGQHMAIFAGFENVRGEIVVTLDADLQNPPEEVPKLVAKMREGYDVVSGWRENRHDSVLRKIPTWVVAQVTSRVVGVPMKDYGSMLRAYRREIVEAMCSSRESSSYIPALANIYAKDVAEIPTAHASRAAGSSKYSIYGLLKLNFDLMTGFSILPLQMMSLLGTLVALVGVAFGSFLILRRLIVGPEVEGVFTLFAILFVFVGLQILCMGLLGEYVGRIYREVRARPRFMVREKRD